MVDVEIGFRNGDSIHTEIDDESAIKFVEIYSVLIQEKKQLSGMQMVGNAFFKAEDVLYYIMNANDQGVSRG